MSMILPKGNKALVYFSFVYLCIMRILEMIGIPHVIEYVLDLTCVLMFALSLNFKLRSRQAYKKPVVLIQIVVFVIGSLIALFNGTSFVLIIWAWRKMFRYLVFFVAILLYLDEYDIDRFFKIIDALSYLNFIMVLVQLFVFGYMQDYVGGIFGILYGLNGDLNNFMLIVTIIMISRWTLKKISFTKMMIHVSMCLIIAVVAELKAYFLELVLVGIICAVLYFLVNNFSAKRMFIWISAGAVFLLLLYIGTTMMGKYYENFQGFFTKERIINEITRKEGYNYSGDINRLTFISGLNEKVSSQKGITRWIGHGFGSWEMSDNQDALSSEYYKEYRKTSYSFFSLPWMYLEVGLIGMVAYILGFVLNGIQGYKILKKKKRNGERIDIVLIGVITSIMSLFILLYNSSMRTISGFLIYFGLSLVYLPMRKKSILKTKLELNFKRR